MNQRRDFRVDHRDNINKLSRIAEIDINYVNTIIILFQLIQYLLCQSIVASPHFRCCLENHPIDNRIVQKLLEIAAKQNF